MEDPNDYAAVRQDADQGNPLALGDSPMRGLIQEMAKSISGRRARGTTEKEEGFQPVRLNQLTERQYRRMEGQTWNYSISKTTKRKFIGP